MFNIRIVEAEFAEKEEFAPYCFNVSSRAKKDKSGNIIEKPAFESFIAFIPLEFFDPIAEMKEPFRTAIIESVKESLTFACNKASKDAKAQATIEIADSIETFLFQQNERAKTRAKAENLTRKSLSDVSESFAKLMADTEEMQTRYKKAIERIIPARDEKPLSQKAAGQLLEKFIIIDEKDVISEACKKALPKILEKLAMLAEEDEIDDLL